MQMAPKWIWLPCIVLVIGLAGFSIYYITQKNHDYEALLSQNPAVDASAVVHANFLDQKILYPFDEVYTQIVDRLSDSDRVKYFSSLEDCRQQISKKLYAFPGYEYREVTIYKQYTYPFLFIGLFGDLYADDEAKHPSDQYDILIKAGEECEVRDQFRLIPDEEQTKIIGYLLRQPEVRDGLFGKTIDEVSIREMAQEKDGTYTVFVSFQTNLQESKLQGKYHWYGLDAQLNLVNGDLEVTPYQYHEQDIPFID